MRLTGGKSLTLRLTLLFAAVSTTVLLLLGLIAAGLAERHFEELDTEVLAGKLDLLQQVLQKVSTPREFAALPQQLEDALVGHPGLAVIVLAPDGRIVFASGGAEFPAALLQRDAPQPLMWTASTQHRYRGIAAAAPTRIAGAAPARVAVATDTARHAHFMSSFRITLWTVVGLAAVLTGFLGWVAARRGLAPLKDITRRAASITANRLDHRLTVAAIPPELAEVADTLNEMLARLEASFRRLSDFSSDLAHELRTPVSNLLTQTQVILSKPRTAEEYREVLASNGEEFERLSRMMADMLFLAKADNDLIVPSREAIDMHREVAGLFDFYEALAADKDVHLVVAGSATVAGDKLMLQRAVSNLLSNAIRHTPPGGRVTVTIAACSDATVALAVENTGATIACEHLPRLFDRFYRAQSARQSFAEGAGLGLAIARSIARAHGGDLAATSEDGITRFTLRLPSRDATPT